MKAKFVFENLDFERGKDPKEAMGLGNQVARDVQKIDDIAKTFGFNRVPEFSEEAEEHLVDIAEWRGPKGMKLVYSQNTTGDKSFFWWMTRRGKPGSWIDEEGNIEDILDPRVWNNILNGEPLYYNLDENVNFKRGQDPKEAMGIGHWGIKRALLDQPPVKVDTMYGDAQRNWWSNGGLPVSFKEEMNYNSSDPLAFTDYISFDEDYYMENELPEWVDPDDFENDFTPIGPRRSIPNTKGWGKFGYQRGKLPDGTIVYKYVDGMGSGYITKKDWLK